MQKMKAIYQISRRTKAIMTNDSPYYRSRIFEGNTYQDHTLKPELILDYNCTINGADMNGRRRYAKHVLKSCSKLPLPVIPDDGVYMVPTSSSRNKDCVWISYYHIADFEMAVSERTYIHFNDGTGLHINISKAVFEKQVRRTGYLIAEFNRPKDF